MAYIFLSVLFLWMDLRVHLCFLKTEALREPRFPAAADAAVIRERRGDDAVGINPFSGQPDPHLHFRCHRRHRPGVRDRICDGASFQSPLLGLQQPAL